MRWVTYRTGDGERTGVVVDGSIHALAPGSLLIDLLGDDGTALREAGARAASEPHEVVELTAADLAPPLRPPQLRDYLCFLEHLHNIVVGLGMEIPAAHYAAPVAYFSSIGTIVGAHDDVAISPGCSQFDFELEVAAIIGRGGADIAPDDAWSHIAGFTIFCDWSARDLLMAEIGGQLGPFKGKDGASTLGPMLVTTDELEPFRTGDTLDLPMRAFVNDGLVGGGSLADMDWTWSDIIAHASRGSVLLPGDAIGSGTVPTGCLIEHACSTPAEFRGWLQPDDTVRLEVDHLGELVQTVRPSGAFHPIRSLEPRDAR